ncbi:MAG TPA: DUF4402 domain-containing protein [Sphingomicrobium sp.]
MRYTLLVAAAAAIVATPAFAQQAPTASDTTSAIAKGVVLQSHQLVKNTDLDFGVVTVDPLNAGTVSISADSSGSRTATGGVTPLPSSYQAANFDGLAAPGETVALTLTPPTGNVLISSSNVNDKITVNSLNLDAAGASRVAGSTGAFTVYVGGTFGLIANQPSGVYSAQFQLTANYQ